VRAPRIGIVLTWLIAAPAAAQTFPASGEYVTLPCRDGPMVDPFQDEAGAIDERDIVGNDGAPAGMRAVDTQFLYLRMRLEADPAPGGVLRPFAWGVELDLDGNRTTYEILIIARGVSNDIALHRNTTTTSPNDPNDPANDPAVAVYPFSTHGRSVVAAGSTYGSDADYFLELAIPWSDLTPLGLTPTRAITAWAATSSSTTSLNADFACFDNATGEPTLDGTAADPTVLDPDADTDGDGVTDAEEVENGSDPTDPDDLPTPSGLVYEGGGGCSIVGGRPVTGTLLLAGFLAWLLLRRRA
jgi:hypothetical protein